MTQIKHIQGTHTNLTRSTFLCTHTQTHTQPPSLSLPPRSLFLTFSLFLYTKHQAHHKQISCCYFGFNLYLSLRCAGLMPSFLALSPFLACERGRKGEGKGAPHRKGHMSKSSHTHIHTHVHTHTHTHTHTYTHTHSCT